MTTKIQQLPAATVPSAAAQRTWAINVCVIAACIGAGLSGKIIAAEAPTPKATMQQVLDASKPGDWRPLDADNTLYMELPGGRVVIELAKAFAPLHTANIRTLVTQKYFDGLAILR